MCTRPTYGFSVEKKSLQSRSGIRDYLFNAGLDPSVSSHKV